MSVHENEVFLSKKRLANIPVPLFFPLSIMIAYPRDNFARAVVFFSFPKTLLSMASATAFADYNYRRRK